MSNLIKPHFYISLEDTKTIESPIFEQPEILPEDPFEPGENQEEMSRILEFKDQVLRDAEEAAEAQIASAMREAETLKEEAVTEIEQWWRERRELDETEIEQARQMGFEEGVRLGRIESEQQVREQYNEQISEARSILEQSYRLQRQIIQEAEPFLIELSCAIAEKIINQQLTVKPEWIVLLTQNVLAKKREKGVITLCVAPGHFQYIQEAREEFLLAVDSQAELQIVPDSTVTDHGCVIRTDFGSVDARIDTQLSEIKQALQQLALRSEPEPEAGRHE